jgi:hypothetical protein
MEKPKVLIVTFQWLDQSLPSAAEGLTTNGLIQQHRRSPSGWLM